METGAEIRQKSANGILEFTRICSRKKEDVG